MNSATCLTRTADTFGRERTSMDMLEQRLAAKALTRRLGEKIKNYEKAAAKLELRGEADAADALHRAADRLRQITVEPPPLPAENASDPA